MRKSFSLVLALAFVLVMSTAALAEEPATISNVLELTVGVTEEEKTAPRFSLKGIAEKSAVGLYDNFTMSVDPGDYGDINALGKISLNKGDVTGFDLEFKRPDGTWFGPVEFEEGVYYFGPKPEGDKLGNVKDTEWRVTWNKAGEYEFEVSIVEVIDDGEIQLGESKTYTVEVVSGEAMALEHAIAKAGDYADLTADEFNNEISKLETESKKLTKDISSGEEFDYVVKANLNNNISHVDNVLFIIEVSKTGINKGDFEITKVSLRDGTEGINDTFKLEDGVLRGYWGPQNGFTFDDEAATAFTVKFNTEGEYTVQVYAIQVEKD